MRLSARGMLRLGAGLSWLMMGRGEGIVLSGVELLAAEWGGMAVDWWNR